MKKIIRNYILEKEPIIARASKLGRMINTIYLTSKWKKRLKVVATTTLCLTRRKSYLMSKSKLPSPLKRRLKAAAKTTCLDKASFI